MHFSIFFSSLLDTLAPPRRSERTLRELSDADLDALLLPLYTQEGDTAHQALLPYRAPEVAAVVWELKYYAHKKARGLAGRLLAEALVAIAAEEVGRPVLIPIPMHQRRRKERGHNQTELLCEAALQETRKKDFRENVLEYMPDVLLRIRHTVPQQGLPQHRRLKNVKNTMTVSADTEKNETLKDRVCIVIDDVATTGATFAEARRALRAAHPRRVYCISLAGA